MIRGIRRSLAAAAALALLCLVPLAAQASKTYTVSDAKSLAKAIGPDRTIVLKKGDYKLSAVSGVKNEYLQWNERENGKEPRISGVKNLTIRGADGARLVGDSPSNYILCIEGGEGIVLDNLRFARVLKGDRAVTGGAFYAESVGGLALTRCRFDGPTGAAIELWKCPGARIKETEISGVTWSAFYFIYSNDVSVSSSKISGSSGCPLVYVEDSARVEIASTRFELCDGNNFFESYTGSGEYEATVFRECTFAGNSFDYFAGTSELPETYDCSYIDDNSFDEYWPDYSVAYVADESYYGNYGGYGYGAAAGIPAYYADWSSGLAFTYPDDWQLEDLEDPRRIGLLSPDGSRVALLVPVSENVDPDLDPEELFAIAAEDFVTYMADNAGSEVQMEMVGEASDETGILSAEYRGMITFLADGGQAGIRVRLLATEGAVHAFAAIANDEFDLEPGLDLDLILGSVDWAPRGE